jgi:3-oxoacyl-[acyl-carrier-protein] synthase I
MTAGDDAIVVSGLGLCSSLGGAIHAAAAFRCGLSNGRELEEWPYFDEEEREPHLLRGHPAMAVAAGFQGAGRLLKLGTLALADLGASLDLTTLHPARLAVILVLPASAEGLERTRGELLSRLCKLARIDVDPAGLHPSFDGRIGVAGAIREAQRLLHGAAIDHCLIGSIDTRLGAEQLQRLFVTGKLKTADNPVGFLPGEGACFLLLERKDRAKRRGGAIGALVHPPSAIAPPDPEEPGPDRRPPGKALSEVMIQAMTQAGWAPPAVGTVYVDLDGTPRRAADFGSALLHLAPARPLEGWQHAFPAESFGETGATSPALAICLAARAFVRGYATGSRALVVMSSETKGKAALGLERVVD